MGKQSSSGSSSRAKGVNARRARKQQDQSLGQAYTALSAKRSNQRRLALKLARRKLAKVEEKLKWHVVEEGNKEQAAAGKALRKERNGLKRDLALALVDDGKEEQAMPLLEDLAPKSAVCRDELLILYIKESKIDEALALLARSSPPPSTATKFSAFLINYLQKFIFTAETSDSESAAAAAAAAPVSDAVLAASFAEATEWNPFAMLLLAFHPLLRSDQRIDPDVVLQLVRDASAEHGEPHAPRGVNEAVLFAADALSYWRDAEGLLAYARKGIRDLVSSRSKEPKSKCGGQNARSVARLCAPLGKGEEGGVPALLRVPEIHTRRHLAQVFGAIFDLVHSDSASDEVFDDEGIGASGAVDGPLSVENLVEFYKKHDPSKAVPSRCRQLLRENTLEELMSGLQKKYGDQPQVSGGEENAEGDDSPPELVDARAHVVAAANAKLAQETEAKAGDQDAEESEVQEGKPQKRKLSAAVLRSKRIRSKKAKRAEKLNKHKRLRHSRIHRRNFRR